MKTHLPLTTSCHGEHSRERRLWIDATDVVSSFVGERAIGRSNNNPKSAGMYT